jgi:transcriptional regulator with XRE-family HTH domain
MVREVSPLGVYLLELCKQRNLSMREASARAGLGVETIGTIVRRGNATKPRPDTLRQIAGALEGDFDRMMVLAGHLPDRPSADSERTELRRKVHRIAELLSTLPPSLQDRLADALIVQTEASKAAFEAGERQTETTQLEE